MPDETCEHKDTVSYPAPWPETHRVVVFCKDCDEYLGDRHEGD